MSLVSAVISKVHQIRNRIFLSNLNRMQKVSVHSARLSVSNAKATEKYRVSILVRASGIAEAESLAETSLQEIVRGDQHSLRGEIELKRLKPRELSPGTVKDESVCVLQLLHKMRRESCQVVSAVEPVEIK